MAQIRQFHDPDELTEEEINCIKETLEDTRPIGSHGEDVVRRQRRDKLRVQNGLPRKEDPAALFWESIEAALEDE